MSSLRCRPALLAAVVVAVVIAVALVVVPPVGAGHPAAQQIDARPVAAVAPTMVSTAASPVPAVDPTLATAAVPPPAQPTPPPLPKPAPLPDPSARVPLVEIARIQIPKTGLDQMMREGVEQMVIDAGPAHWPGTASPGGWGNMVIAGHRTTHTEPFLRNAELAPGDAILVSDLTGTYTYHVTNVEVVANTALWIVDQHPGRTLTIFTCHPIGSSAQRLIVQAQLVSAPRPGA